MPNPRSSTILLLFVPAIALLLRQILIAPTIAHRLLAIALCLLTIDQTRMAIVDLDNIATLKPQTTPALQRFTWVTWSTIGLELVGCYLGAMWLGGGSAIVLLSQLWFNFLAGVQLVPDANAPIQPWGIRDRAIVLVADSLGLGLACLYALNIQPFATAISLLTMVLLYILIKYWPHINPSSNSRI
jgi:hypothetical protein